MNPGKKASQGWIDPLLRPVAAHAIPSAGLDVTVAPDDAERAALARALNLAAVQSLSARYRLTHAAGGAIHVLGEIVARVKPVCVVTLEAFDLEIREPVDVRFAEEQDERDADEFDMLAGDEPPDPMENGMLDLGKVTTEFLSLAVPPFPRKPDAAFSLKEEEPAARPFAGLAALKPGKSAR
ncbi:MAG TPA: DUF177 domain-containing protein [Beijerinckiaceae bacterium]|nr:DUF177 domain-containing protein [Beijerinckiaceae bacterium]